MCVLHSFQHFSSIIKGKDTNFVDALGDKNIFQPLQTHKLNEALRGPFIIYTTELHKSQRLVGVHLS